MPSTAIHYRSESLLTYSQVCFTNLTPASGQPIFLPVHGSK